MCGLRGAGIYCVKVEVVSWRDYSDFFVLQARVARKRTWEVVAAGDDVQSFKVLLSFFIVLRCRGRQEITSAKYFSLKRTRKIINLLVLRYYYRS